MFYKIKYYLSWWAYSFPVAAITIASILIFHETGLIFFKYISFLLFAILTFIILVLLAKTAKAVTKAEICVEAE